MKINQNNIINHLLFKLPILANSPGFEESDKKLPYVAFGMFKPFVIKDKKLLRDFLALNSDIYNNTEDNEVINLIHVEIFEDFHRIGEGEIMKNCTGKMKDDFIEYLKTFDKNSICN